jgi:hypothetical protein
MILWPLKLHKPINCFTSVQKKFLLTLESLQKIGIKKWVTILLFPIIKKQNKILSSFIKKKTLAQCDIAMILIIKSTVIKLSSKSSGLQIS